MGEESKKGRKKKKSICRIVFERQGTMRWSRTPSSAAEGDLAKNPP